jgi:tryptophanyl-tRNA synthetase
MFRYMKFLYKLAPLMISYTKKRRDGDILNIQKKVALTGIKPTGELHLGNYIGAIKPAIELSKATQFSSIYFIADYHALTALKNGPKMKEYIYKSAATWLALGLDPEQVIFYKQSDIPEIFELSWILSCHTSKGLLNRAHAYKSIRDKNIEAGIDPDTDINMGLYTYPILMTADILLFHSNVIPVGKDQIQHVEIARDIAQSFNSLYGETFTIPEYQIADQSSVLIGVDGRKMSKSYNNTLPIFSDSKTLKNIIFKIKTNSLPPEAPKDPDDSILFSLYKEFSDESQVHKMRERFYKGIAWGDVKKELLATIEDYFRDSRNKYFEYLNDTAYLDSILKTGAQKAREIASKSLKDIKNKIGTV